MTTITVTTDAEVDLEEIDTNDLVEELSRRDVGCGESVKELIDELFYAFKFGKNDLVLSLAKQIAQEHKGMIL